MSQFERVRDFMTEPPDAEYFRNRAAEGWKLLAVEWQRETASPAAPPNVEVPFGLQVARDCLHLEENPTEKEQLLVMLDMIVEDRPLSAVAEELNRRGFRTRVGSRWTTAAVFDLLPRMIETSPAVFSSTRWQERVRAR